MVRLDVATDSTPEVCRHATECFLPTLHRISLIPIPTVFLSLLMNKQLINKHPTPPG